MSVRRGDRVGGANANFQAAVDELMCIRRASIQIPLVVRARKARSVEDREPATHLVHTLGGDTLAPLGEESSGEVGRVPEERGDPVHYRHAQHGGGRQYGGGQVRDPKLDARSDDDEHTKREAYLVSGGEPCARLGVTTEEGAGKRFVCDGCRSKAG